MLTARPELPYLCNSWPSRGTRLLGGGSNVTARSHKDIPFRTFWSYLI